MMWRIFWKDCRQLWRLAAIVAGAQAVNAALRLVLGAFNQPGGLVTFAELFSAATVLGMATLIVAVVHEDVLPGVSQDWLIRPIRRGDLLGAKLVFVAAVVQGPALLADVAHGIAAGLAVHDSLAASLARSTLMLLVFDVPALALATVTSTLVQAVATLVAIWLMVMTGVFASIIARGGAPPPFASSGIQWMTPAYWSVVACTAAVMVIPLQYFRRATAYARRIVAVAVLLAPVLSVSTWASAFAVQERLSRDARSAEPISITFDAASGPVERTVDAGPTRTLLLPLLVSGLADDSILVKDRADIRLVNPDGVTFYRGRTTPALGYGNDFVARAIEGGEVRLRQSVVLPHQAYEELRKQPVRVELDYSLTLFQIADAGTLAAAQGNQRLSGFGRCRAQVDDDGDEVDVGCLQAGAAPTCVSVTIGDHLKQPPQWRCDPDYAPYRAQLYPSSISRFSMRLPVPPLPSATLQLKSYRPEAHFTRRLVVSRITVAEESR